MAVAGMHPLFPLAAEGREILIETQRNFAKDINQKKKFESEMKLFGQKIDEFAQQYQAIGHGALIYKWEDHEIIQYVTKDIYQGDDDQNDGNEGAGDCSLKAYIAIAQDYFNERIKELAKKIENIDQVRSDKIEQFLKCELFKISKTKGIEHFDAIEPEMYCEIAKSLQMKLEGKLLNGLLISQGDKDTPAYKAKKKAKNPK